MMKRRKLLKGIGAGTLATTLGTGSATAIAGGDDVGPQDVMPTCDDYVYCNDCLRDSSCDEAECFGCESRP